ncbi:hypothetical protein EVAR_66509_1 [Eumeta japonica]|uniref:Uncharacterized protein n=1 Tax=Eumeta variegata TaxID=151549 RepID=A0A4C1ZAI8_EUMVA|nr:hypothetical protein EVAR_66509_1 [Eumeta japonica]
MAANNHRMRQLLEHAGDIFLDAAQNRRRGLVPSGPAPALLCRGSWVTVMLTMVGLRFPRRPHVGETGRAQEKYCEVSPQAYNSYGSPHPRLSNDITDLNRLVSVRNTEHENDASTVTRGQRGHDVRGRVTSRPSDTMVGRGASCVVELITFQEEKSIAEIGMKILKNPNQKQHWDQSELIAGLRSGLTSRSVNMDKTKRERNRCQEASVATQ